MTSIVDTKKERSYREGEPFICKLCNRVWQHLREQSFRCDYLIGFPKYGCSSKLCIGCLNKL
jgi:hypothetical protein